MREIKFRARDKKTGEIYHQGIDFDEIYFGKEGTKVKLIKKILWVDVIPEQYTGLHDKNNKEIYEGDIIKFTGNYTTAERCGPHKGIIAWQKDEAGFYIKVKGFERPFSIWDETNEFNSSAEVIGNIYENPELLEEK